MVISRTATSVIPRLPTTMPFGDVPFARMVSLTPVPGVADPVAVTPARRRSSDAATTSVLLNLVIGATPALPRCRPLVPEAAERRRAGCQPEAVREERDRVIEADERDQLEDLIDTERRRERDPQLFGDARRIVQLVDQPDQQPLLGIPGRIIGVPVHRRPHLLRRQGRALLEECDVDAPRARAGTPRARSVADDLAMPERDWTAGETAAGSDAVARAA